MARPYPGRPTWLDWPTPPPGFEEGRRGPLMASRAPGPEGDPSPEDLLANAESCPHFAPMPEGRKSSCGCQHMCKANLGPRRRKGGVLLTDCWACPEAPRRSQGG